MANGKNVEQGTHSELLKNESGAYSALVRLQLEAGEGGTGGGEKSREEKKKGKSAGGSSPSSSPSASPGSSPAGVSVISADADEAASVASASASAASAARAAEGAAAAGAASAAAKRAAASDAAPEHALGWRRLWALSRSDWPSVLVGVLGSAALGESVFIFLEGERGDEKNGQKSSTLNDFNPLLTSKLILT